MQKVSKLEFKVGLFVIVAFICLAAFVFSVTDSSVFAKGKTLKVVFSFANGLKKSAPVRIAGVDEGIVKDINLFFDRQDGRTKAEVKLWVKEATQVPADSIVMVNHLGLMGEKYVEITPGIETEKFISEGQIIVGKEPISQSAISDRIMQVSKKVESVVSGIDEIINSEKNTASISEILANVSSMTSNFDSIAKSLEEGKGTVGKFLQDDSIYDDLQELSSDLKENPWKLLYRPKESKN
ncbi:MAG: MlaD family protein [Candidatus Zapsychrus exili]|nr:MlaD family protein [Candidatus Zapsychrus exili]